MSMDELMPAKGPASPQRWGTGHGQCDSCRSAPCAFYCRADAASLCAACDADVHSANPLARRHRRVPIAAPPHPSASAAFVVRPGGLNSSAWPLADVQAAAGGNLNKSDADDVECKEDDEEEASSWLLLKPFEDADVDAFLDLGVGGGSNCRPEYEKGDVGGELVVPGEQQQSFQMEMMYDTSRNAYGSYSLSLSSMEASVDQECAAVDVTSSFLRPSKSTIELFSSAVPPAQMPTQLVGLDREARLLRYREKRKMRRFEKTIRYASRKAYAETRPRIKGRFAKRADVDIEVDQYLSAAALAADSGYGVVPTF